MSGGASVTRRLPYFIFELRIGAYYLLIRLQRIDRIHARRPINLPDYGACRGQHDGQRRQGNNPPGERNAVLVGFEPPVHGPPGAGTEDHNSPQNGTK